MLLLKDQLLFKDHYQWPDIPANDPKISGELADVPFEPRDGNQVLYLINQLLLIWKFDEMKYARKVEKMIKAGIPYDIGSQLEAKAWIKENWTNY